MPILETYGPWQNGRPRGSVNAPGSLSQDPRGIQSVTWRLGGAMRGDEKPEISQSDETLQLTHRENDDTWWAQGFPGGLC